MAVADILDLRNEHGYIEVYPITTRQQVASVWRTGGVNGPTPTAWPPETSDEWFAFSSNADYSVDYGNVFTDGRWSNSYQAGWAVGQEGVYNLFWDDNERAMYAIRSMSNESQIVNGLLYFDLSGLPVDTPVRVDLIFLPYQWNNIDNYSVGIEQYDTVGTYVDGANEQPNPMTDYTSGLPSPKVATVNMADVGGWNHTSPSPDTEYGHVVLPGFRWAIPLGVDLATFTTETFRGFRFIMDSAGVPTGTNWLNVEADYGYYNTNIGSGLRDAGWYLPHLRIWYEETALTAIAQFTFGFGFEYMLDLYDALEELAPIYVAGVIKASLRMRGKVETRLILSGEDERRILNHKAKKDRLRQR